jgi:hypothetical protein
VIFLLYLGPSRANHTIYPQEVINLSDLTKTDSEIATPRLVRINIVDMEKE